jgi:hypothetical protein
MRRGSFETGIVIVVGYYEGPEHLCQVAGYCPVQPAPHPRAHRNAAHSRALSPLKPLYQYRLRQLRHPPHELGSLRFRQRPQWLTDGIVLDDPPGLENHLHSGERGTIW